MKLVDGVNRGVVNVDARALKDALAAVKSAIRVELEVGDSGVTVSSGGTSITVPAVSGQYPNVKRFWLDNVPGDTFTVKHLAFHAQYIYEISRSTGRTPSNMGAVILTATTELKPMCLRMKGEEGWRALIMPIRVDI